MAYQTYITDAIVCGSWNRNTADKSILLFAREAGMVYVQAKSIRREHSKQRYALQDASYARVTLIRGKSGWKVASAESRLSLYERATTRSGRALVRDTILLLRRVMQGEIPHQAIFDDVLTALRGDECDEHKTRATVLFARILYALGYVAPAPAYAHILQGAFPTTVGDTTMNISDTTYTILDGVIQNALRESQL